VRQEGEWGAAFQPHAHKGSHVWEEEPVRRERNIPLLTLVAISPV